MQEVLRMYPPVGIGQIRVSHSHDLVLCGGALTVPRGTLLWMPHHAMHNTSANWDQPHSFLPGQPLICVLLFRPSQARPSAFASDIPHLQIP